MQIIWTKEDIFPRQLVAIQRDRMVIFYGQGTSHFLCSLLTGSCKSFESDVELAKFLTEMCAKPVVGRVIGRFFDEIAE